MSDESLLSARELYQDALEEALRAHSLTPGEFGRLVNTPLERLSRDQVTTLLAIRDALPGIDADTVLQKIVPPAQAAKAIGMDVMRSIEPELASRVEALAGRPRPLDGIGGFVGSAASVAGLSPSELYRAFGLDYQGTPFVPDGESMFAVRYRAGDARGFELGAGQVDPWIPSGPLRAMESMPDRIYAIADDGARRVAIKQWVDGHPEAAGYPKDAGYPIGRDAKDALDVIDGGRPRKTPPRNPFRGNGFGGRGLDFAPELAYANAVRVPDGAELWRIKPDGSQELTAVYRGSTWALSGERPAVTP
jgi:hypothetical protein